MTYLEFQIEEISKAGVPVIGSARFLIDDDDPRECVRKAVSKIRGHGWMPIMLREADYGVARHELESRHRLASLFSDAAVSGCAFKVEPAIVNSQSFHFSSQVAAAT